MSTNRQPAGTSVGGQWAPGASGEVDDILDLGEEGFGPDETTDFSRFGLRPETTPDGLDEAWAEHQAILEQDKPESTDAIIARELGLPDDAEVFYTGVKSNQSGIVYAEAATHTDDQDDDGEAEQVSTSPYHAGSEFEPSDAMYSDGGYWTHRFAVPAGDPLADRLTSASDDRERVSAEIARHEREKEIERHINEGRMGPWATLGEGGRDEIQREASAGTWLGGGADDEELNRAESNISDHEAFTAAATGEELPDEVAQRHPAIASKLAKMREKKAVLDLAVEAREEAQSLPEDSPLRRHLLTPPPTWTYQHNINAGTRKRKKMETRTVHPKPLINKAVDDAELHHSGAARDFNVQLGPLTHNAERGREVISRHTIAQNRIRQARDEAWSFGWPDDGTTPPPHPEESR